MLASFFGICNVVYVPTDTHGHSYMVSFHYKVQGHFQDAFWEAIVFLINPYYYALLHLMTIYVATVSVHRITC